MAPKPWASLTEREKLLRRAEMLKIERMPRQGLFLELSQQFAPANGRFFSQQPNRAVIDYGVIADPTGIDAVDTSVAGLMSIASNPAVPWIRYTTRDPDLDTFLPVQNWLADAAFITLDVFDDSNTYTVLPQYYRELLTFATACGMMLPDFDRVIHHYPKTCGEYYLGQDSKQVVNTYYCEYHMTVAQMHERFGFERLSPAVQRQFTNGDLDTPHMVGHLIEPRKDRVEGRISNDNLPWRSVYWEIGNDGLGVLDDSGYEDFPILAPRWDTVGNDVYGIGPGNKALSHSKALQVLTEIMALAVHKQADPPKVWPTAMKGQDINTNPGGDSFADGVGANGGGRALADFKPDVMGLMNLLLFKQNQVKDSFFARFFTHVISDPRNERATAAEIQKVTQEAWMMLGPFARRLFSELLSPMVSMTFKHLLRNGGFPPPPDELIGRTISVRMISPLAIAQEQVSANADDRFVFAMTQVAAIKPNVVHSFDENKWAQRYSRKIGSDPEFIRSAEEARQLAEAHDRALAAKEQTEMANTQAATAETLSNTTTEGNNALAALAGAGAEA